MGLYKCLCVKSRSIILFICFFSALTLFFSCKKEEVRTVELASFTVANSVPSLSVKTDFTGKENVAVLTDRETIFDQCNNFAVASKQLVPVTVVSSIDPANVVFHQSFNFDPGDIYSLFVMGELGSIDTLLIKENIPEVTDSSFRLRFIHGSPTSGPLKINFVRINNSGEEFAESKVIDLNYKGATEFISFPFKSSTMIYRIELRNPTTNDLITSFYGQSIIRNVRTYVIRGTVGGDPDLGVLRISHAGV